MSIITIGLGGCAVSKQPGDIIKTYALGSCVAVITYDPSMKIAGMIHVVLPEASIAPQKVSTQPAYFADTGIQLLLRKMEQWGSSGRYIIKLVGGAQIGDPNYYFNVGKRNVLATRKYLWANRKVPYAEDIGGMISRTVEISVDTGIVLISNPEKGRWEL